MPTESVLQSKFERMEKAMQMFEDLQPDALTMRIHALNKEIASLRADGYAALDTLLETRLSSALESVQQFGDDLTAYIDRQRPRLKSEFRQAESWLRNLNAESEQSMERAEKELDDLERAIEEAREYVMPVAGPILQDVEAVEKLVKRIPYYLQMRNEASFEFDSGEHVVMASKAESVVTGKASDDPDGIVFLTNQRVLFEQKEKVGKRFGMFGGKMEHGLQWAYALSQIGEVKHEDQGMLRGKDMLMLLVLDEDDHKMVTLEIKDQEDNSEWAERIETLRRESTN